MARRWSNSDFVTLDAAGAGTISIQAPSGGCTVRHAVVSTTPADPYAQPTVTVYRDAEDPLRRLDSTTKGNGDASSDVFELAPGESYIAVWAGGPVGGRAVLRLEGTTGDEL